MLHILSRGLGDTSAVGGQAVNEGVIPAIDSGAASHWEAPRRPEGVAKHKGEPCQRTPKPTSCLTPAITSDASQIVSSMRRSAQNTSDHKSRSARSTTSCVLLINSAKTLESQRQTWPGRSANIQQVFEGSSPRNQIPSFELLSPWQQRLEPRSRSLLHDGAPALALHGERLPPECHRHHLGCCRIRQWR